MTLNDLSGVISKPKLMCNCITNLLLLLFFGISFWFKHTVQYMAELEHVCYGNIMHAHSFTSLETHCCNVYLYFKMVLLYGCYLGQVSLVLNLKESSWLSKGQIKNNNGVMCEIALKI